MTPSARNSGQREGKEEGKKKKEGDAVLYALYVRIATLDVICFSVGRVNFWMMRTYGRRLNRLSRREKERERERERSKFSFNMVSGIGSAAIRIIRRVGVARMRTRDETRVFHASANPILSPSTRPPRQLH